MAKIFRRFAARFSYKNLAAIYVAEKAKRRPKKEEESGVAAKPATGGDIGTAKPVPPPKKKKRWCGKAAIKNSRYRETYEAQARTKSSE